MEVGRMAGGGRRPLALLGGMTTNTPLLVGAVDIVLRPWETKAREITVRVMMVAYLHKTV